MSKTLSVADVKAHLSEYLRDVESGESVIITRNGKPVAALVPSQDLSRLELLRAQGPEGGLSSIAGGWPGSDELVAGLESAFRSESRHAPDAD